MTLRGTGGRARRRAAPSPARRHRRGARRDPRPARRPRPERPRARDVQRHVERALLVQELEAAAADAARPPARASSPARARTPASSRSATGSRSRSRSSRTTTRRAVEPYQGAATGVGGILRDIFTMGARPIAVLDALRFGDPADAADAAPRRRRRARRRRLRQLRRRADGRRRARLRPELPGQPARQRHGDRPARGAAPDAAPRRPGPGNLVVLFGSTTGRDGIGGASVLASATFTDDDPSKRPTRPGRRPVRREAADRGVARADRARPRRGPPGPRRRRDHLRDLGDGRSGRHRDRGSTSTRSRGASRAWRRSR